MTFTSTESIFTVIGDSPVLDQFDVCYDKMLSGSILDEYVTGSLLKSYTINGFSWYGEGTRGRAFNKLADKGLENVVIDSNKSYSYCLQPRSERSGIIRNCRIFSSSERFYDSFVPDLSSILSKLGGGIFVSLNWNNEGIITFNKGASGTLFNEDISASGWTNNFPFSPQFSGIQRVKNIENSFIATRLSPDGTLDSYTSVKKKVKIFTILDYDYFSGDPFEGENGLGRRYCMYVDNLSGGSFTHIQPSDVSKIIFGFGDLQGKTFVSSNGINSHVGSREFASPRTNIGYFSLNLSFSPMVRGWKYGLASGTPIYTSAIFRRNRYGQLRDMLEQRLFVSSMTDFENSPSHNFDINEGSPLPYPIEGARGSYVPSQPVEVKFVKQAIRGGRMIFSPVDPTNTMSSNLSSYATSSLPYFDGIPKNRDPENDLSSPRNTILSVKSDIFGNSMV